MQLQPQQKPAEERHLDAIMRWHIVKETSGGACALGEVLVSAGSEPPMHVHAREDEAWYILEGSVLFQRGLERILCGPGDSIFLPRGIQHGFAVETPSARILHFYTPGGLEAAFRAENPKMEEEFAKQGVTFVGPPLPVILAGERTAIR